ncbi:MAG: hypothetical protein CM15mP128_5120 [Methanobacteriota archaeon]|nr:MAG: hypothetical protein CM15mP128_5120 [Euryarchaeota archaeon]
MSRSGDPRTSGDVSMFAASRKPLERLAVVTLRMSTNTMADIRALTTEAHDHAQREAFTDASGPRPMARACLRCQPATGWSMLDCAIGGPAQSAWNSLGRRPPEVVAFTADEAWEHLVMVASGLDAFVLGELQCLDRSVQPSNITANPPMLTLNCLGSSNTSWGQPLGPGSPSVSHGKRRPRC